MQRFPRLVLAVAFPCSVVACGGRESPEPSREPAAAARSVAAAPVAVSPRASVPVEQEQATAAGASRATAERAPPGAAPATSPSSLQAPSTAAPAASDDGAAVILARAERAWKGVRAFRADFVQDLSVPLMGTEQRSRGQLLHRRPDRFLMKFSDPAGDVVVADGTHLWMYYPSTDRTQVVRAAASAAGGQLDLQREFLDNPTARYNVALTGEESVGGRPAELLTLTPKGASPYRRIRVWVDQGDHLVRRFELTEENGSARRLELSNLQVNPDLPDPLFRFTPPAGAQIFDQ